MVFFLFFGIVMLLPGAIYAALAIRSKNPDNLISTTGELTLRKGYKNYKLKGRTAPNATGYTYTYTVAGKPYALRGVQLTHPRNLPKRVVIVYLRGFPRCAYQDQFSGIAERLLAISLLAAGLLCIVISFAVA